MDIISGLFGVILEPLEPLECGKESWKAKQDHDDSCNWDGSETSNTGEDEENALNNTEYTHDFHAGGNWEANAAFKILILEIVVGHLV